MEMSVLRWIADSGRIFCPAITCGFHHSAFAEVPRQAYSFPSTSVAALCHRHWGVSSKRECCRSYFLDFLAAALGVEAAFFALAGADFLAVADFAFDLPAAFVGASAADRALTAANLLLSVLRRS
jgi:hypothetical protein